MHACSRLGLLVLCGARIDDSTMAIINRFGTNVNSFVAKFYSKHIPQKLQSLNAQIPRKQLLDHDDKISRAHQSFREMLSFRQDQAERSILIRIHNLSNLNELQRMLPCSDIISFQPYFTMNDKVFVLLEFQSAKSVRIMGNTIGHVPMKDIVHAHSPIYIYKSTVTLRNIKQEPLKNTIYSYSNFKCCTLTEIWQKLRSTKTVEEQMVVLSDTLAISELDIRLRFYTAAQISYYVSKLFANISVLPFGSSVNGFGQLGCDLDLMCQINYDTGVRKWKTFHSLGQHFSLDDRHYQIEYLELLSSVMKRCIPGITNIKKILEARVPIVKFYNMFTNMQCDLSSSNTAALKMSEILYTYSKYDWRVKPLVFTIRKWARIENITKTVSGPWMTNFSLTLLVIFYLQNKKILPALAMMKILDGEESSTKTDYHNYSESKYSSVPTNKEELYPLLYGFFEYYSIFDFATKAICVRHAVVKRKEDNSPLYICNPLENALNVSKNVHTAELRYIVDKFHTALQTLIETDEKNAILKLLKLTPAKMSNIRTLTESAEQKIADDILQDDDINESNTNVVNQRILAKSTAFNAKSIIK